MNRSEAASPPIGQDLLERAMAAMLRYRDNRGFPSQDVIDDVRDRLARLTVPGPLYDWRDVLDTALADAGYDVEWQGEAIYAVMQGRPRPTEQTVKPRRAGPRAARRRSETPLEPIRSASLARSIQ